MNISELHNICNASFKHLRGYGDYTAISPHSGYTFIDNGADVLGVAHIDTVQSSQSFKVSKKRRIVFSPRLDDRLGVFTLLKVLPEIGIKTDILLTEDEESGNSTAQFFNSSKQYNWIYEFDRGGDTTVLYQYDNATIRSILESYGFKIDDGLYTDICDLEHLECIGINFSTGYYLYHSVHAYARLLEWQTSVKQFVSFYRDHHSTYMEHDPSYFDTESSNWFMRDYSYLESISWEKYKESEKCEICGRWYRDSYNIGLIRYTKVCEKCLEMGY